MNDQLDKLESSVARLIEAFEALKRELADKQAAVDLLQEESNAVRARIETLIASLSTGE